MVSGWVVDCVEDDFVDLVGFILVFVIGFQGDLFFWCLFVELVGVGVDGVFYCVFGQLWGFGGFVDFVCVEFLYCGWVLYGEGGQ